MNIKLELNRGGERSNWEPFGDFAIKPYFDFPKPRTGLLVTIKVLYAPGSVDRAFEKMYADD